MISKHNKNIVRQKKNKAKRNKRKRKLKNKTKRNKRFIDRIDSFVKSIRNISESIVRFIDGVPKDDSKI